MFTISYGVKNKTIDITSFVYTNCIKNLIIYIPKDDNKRAFLFGDPFFGIVKSIFIKKDGEEEVEYNDTLDIFIDVKTNLIYTNKIFIPSYILDIYVDYKIDYKLANIHKRLNLKYGDLMEEYTEQKMAVRYLTGYEKVLEIGGNIGRNSLIIAYLLNEKENNDFVTLECAQSTAQLLCENRDLNNFNFHVEDAALSKKKIYQQKWVNNPIAAYTVEIDKTTEDLSEFSEVKSITWEELFKKYQINFDTLILDCEGAFYNILLSMPEILDNINLIIMENDYLDIAKKEYVDEVLKQNNFYVDYQECGPPCTKFRPCHTNFYEVWKKKVQNEIINI
jgi:FkbM family methyltransferase